MNVSPAGGGDIQIDGLTPVAYPASFQYAKGFGVVLEAVPASGYHFTGWSGDLSGSTSPATLAMTCDKSVTASFSSQESVGGSIGDFVWMDSNWNGIQDTGEPGISNVTVNLYDVLNNLIATAVTQNGYYLFPNLAAGSYTIEFIAPDCHVFAPQDRGSNDAIDSDASSTGRTAAINLAANDNLNTDAGLYSYTMPTFTYSIPLVAGWNLVSLPLIPDSTAISDVLAGVDIRRVFAFDTATGLWQTYQPGASGGLTDIVPGRGYWFSAGTPGTLTVHGRLPSLPFQVTLSPGWNLVGFPLISSSCATYQLAGISPGIVAGYDGVSTAWELVNNGWFGDSSWVKNGQGYWVKMAESTTLTIVPALGDITVAQADALIRENSGNPDFVILDVRTAGEYNGGYITGAQNLDYYSSNFVNGLNALDRSKMYLVVCQSGRRSAFTLEIMQRMGFREAYNMLGGMNQWQAQGLPY